jgi:hypothetical protein
VPPPQSFENYDTFYVGRWSIRCYVRKSGGVSGECRRVSETQPQSKCSGHGSLLESLVNRARVLVSGGLCLGGERGSCSR